MRVNQLKCRYGITAIVYDVMLLKQGGVCGVCKKTQKSGRRLAVDHDHETGRVRGLLCQMCNSRVEKFLDYIRAAEGLGGAYLDEYVVAEVSSES